SSRPLRVPSIAPTLRSSDQIATIMLTAMATAPDAQSDRAERRTSIAARIEEIGIVAVVRMKDPDKVHDADLLDPGSDRRPAFGGIGRVHRWTPGTVPTPLRS